MDIKRSCILSPLIDYNKPIISTPRNQLPLIFSLDSKTSARNGTSIIDGASSEKDILLDKQFRLERDITHEMSRKTEDLFTTTYTSLQTILSQMQLKLSNVFLQETEYLKYREQQIEKEEQSLTKRIKQLKSIQNQQKQIENQFTKLKNRIETTVVQLIKFQTNGSQIFQRLFIESHQIDEQLSKVISQSITSLNRSRTIIHSKINEFSYKSNHIQSELTDRQVFIQNTQLSIRLILELVNILNQFNIQHSQDIIINKTDFKKRYQQFNDRAETTNYHWDINKEMKEVCLLENEKIQLEKELLEQTILLENIYSILGKAITS